MLYKIDGQAFETIKAIGRGSSSRVYLAVRKSDNVQVSLKFITNDSINVANEVRVHQSLCLKNNQRGIVQFISADVKHGIIVTEYCSNGSLSSYLQQSGGIMTELEARWYLSTVINGIVHMHRNGYLHRDIKLSNILLNEGHLEAKLADFGFAIAEEDLISEPTQLKCGTLSYLAPEIANRSSHRYSYPADIWSFGVLAFKLLTGSFPLLPFNSNLKLLGNLSQVAVSFLQPLLDNDPEKRPTSFEVQSHPFLVENLIWNIFSYEQAKTISRKSLPKINVNYIARLLSHEKTYESALGTLSPKASSIQFRLKNESSCIEIESDTFSVKFLHTEPSVKWDKDDLPTPLALLFYFVYRTFAKILSKIPKSILADKETTGVLMSNAPIEDFWFQVGKGDHVYRFITKSSKIFIYENTPNDFYLLEKANISVFGKSQLNLKQRPTKSICLKESTSAYYCNEVNILSILFNVHSICIRLSFSCSDNQQQDHPLYFSSHSTSSVFPISSIPSRSGILQKMPPISSSNEDVLSLSSSMFSATSINTEKRHLDIQIVDFFKDSNGVYQIFFSDSTIIYMLPDRSIFWHQSLNTWISTNNKSIPMDFQHKISLFSKQLPLQLKCP